ncbi:hypothetical protein GCM10011390_36570 [Aureimonas endophytica]|uniref:HTH tetR-type domain-containing protein n=1 Tax=Aureimonas endophytica TaxID=2027858 RepID=A0A916ZU18_9HYPH|nr:TetR/AcrR family transcriptional regulator [Aureimonas endophytica]GGE14075.1 hypothetical protein GCM10011390_36570 [Aureimonas endophytica]
MAADAKGMMQGRHGSEGKAGEILDRIATTVARKGLDGASMQDLAASAGMSVGNFYRYYPSKIALVTALVDQCASDVRADFAAALDAADPVEGMRAILDKNLFAMSRDEAALWLQIDAAALVHPEIAAVKAEMDRSIEDNVFRLVGRLAGPGAEDSAVVGEVAEFLLLFCSSLFRQRAFEDEASFLPKARRMTDRLFAWAQSELGSARAAEQPLKVAS